MNKRKIILRSAFLLTILLISYAVWNLYYIMPTIKAKPQIQAFLNQTYNNNFQIISIEKDFCPDLFHQPWGYKLVLSDKNNVQFNNILIQYNKYQKAWITYGGIDIEKEYEKAKKSEKKGSRQH